MKGPLRQYKTKVTANVSTVNSAYNETKKKSRLTV